MQDKKSDQYHKKIRRRRLLFLILLPVALWLSSNLWLISPWGRNFVEKKLSQKSGLEWRISGSWWTPWSGISLWDLELHIAKDSEALVTLPETQVQLYWKDLLQRKVNLQQINVEKPVIKIDIDELKQWLAQQPVKKWEPKDAPQLAIAPAPELRKTATPPQGVRPSVKESSPGEPEPKKPAKTQQKETAPTLAKPASTRPLMMLVNDAQIKIEHGGKQLFDVDGIDLRLPMIGEETTGELKVKAISVLGNLLIENLTLPTQRYGAVVGVVQEDVSLHGLKLSWSAQMNLQSRVFRLLLATPQQELSIDLGDEMIIAAEAAVVRAELVGRLSELSTWNGGAIASLRELRVADSAGEISFTKGQFNAFCRSGNVLIPSISLISEDLSLLGNGFMQSNGFVCGVIRLIGSPESAVSVQQRIQPTKPLNDWWQDYESPDRKYRDIQLEGDFGNWKILDRNQWFTTKQWLSEVTQSSMK